MITPERVCEMNTIQYDRIVKVESISEFIIRDREWFSYYNDIIESNRVVDKITGAALPRHITNEKESRVFLISISDEKLNAVIKNIILYLDQNNIKYPINKTQEL